MELYGFGGIGAAGGSETAAGRGQGGDTGFVYVYGYQKQEGEEP